MAKQMYRRRHQHKPSTGEKNSGEKVVVPGDGAGSVRELLTKHATNLNFDNYKTPFYEEQAQFSTLNLNKIQKMDLPEKLIHLKKFQEQAKGLEGQIKSYQKELNEAVEARNAELEAARAASKSTKQGEGSKDA